MRKSTDTLGLQGPGEGVFGLVELLLKDRPRLFRMIEDKENLSQAIPELLAITLFGAMIVGGILGTYTGGWQVLYVALKLPLLLLLTLAICHLCFWTWGLYFRVRLCSAQVATLTLSSIATTSLLLLGLSPLLWLALGGGTAALVKLSLYQQEFHYHKAILVMVCTFGIAGLGGVRVLYRGLQALTPTMPCHTKRLGGASWMVSIWIGVYGLVGLQVAWILRPYLFHPWANGRPLTFVRAIDGSVYDAVIKIILGAVGLGS